MPEPKYKTLQELFADPSRWTKGIYARDAQGKPVNSRDPKATCWCLVGGIYKVYPDRVDWNEAFEKLWGGPQSPEAFNDRPTTTHKDILDLVTELDI